jgi:hypothetical protein
LGSSINTTYILYGVLASMPRLLKNANGRVSRDTLNEKDGNISLPPMLDLTPSCFHRYRYRAFSAAALVGIGVGAILQAIGCIATSTTVMTSMASSFKIKRLTLYPPQVAGSDSCSVNWSSGANFGIARDIEISKSLPDGISNTGKMVFTPRRSDLCSDWISSNNGAGNTVLIITCPTGTIIDLDVAFTLVNTFGGAPVTITGPASVGSTYYAALDGAGSNKLRPVLMSTIS